MADDIQRNKENIEEGKRGKKNKGHIELILGPMFSGKSTELMRRLKRYQVTNYILILDGDVVITI